MRSQLPEHAVVTLLRQCFITPKCRTSPFSLARISQSPSCRNQFTSEEQRRCYQTHSRRNDAHPTPSNIDFRSHQSDLEQSKERVHHNDGVTRIAVLGSGITGLATAHYLAKELPGAKITIYEKGNRIGGWLRTKSFSISEHIKSKAGATVYFESGPRTLRPGSVASPAGLVTSELIQDLKLEDKILITPQESFAARNRYLYYPDHLVKMPGPGQKPLSLFWNLYSEPVFEKLVGSFWSEAINPRRPTNLEDESVGSFLNRRFGRPNITDNIASAVLHGIYAGNIYNLSVKSLLPTMWHLDSVYGSLIRGMMETTAKNVGFMKQRDLKLASEMMRESLDMTLMKMMSVTSVYTFRGGISTLSLALEKRLKANPNVKFKLDTEISSLEHDSDRGGIMVQTSSKNSSVYSRVISTIPGRTLSTLAKTHTTNDPTPKATPPGTHLPSLSSIHSVTVMVVNLFYADPSLLPARGFGYLIPRSIPLTQNPEMALGVIFDSDATKYLDTIAGTKVTVMLGGHWWDGFDGEYPSERDGVSMAKALLKRHLNIDARPELAMASLQRECIPQYSVGHETRMKRAHGELMNAFAGKVAVAGNSYTGVGVNDCVRAARDVVMDIKYGMDVTGLEEFVSPSPWLEVDKKIIYT